MDRLNGAAAAVADGVLSLPDPDAFAARKELPSAFLEKLKAPLPPQAVSPNTERPGLSAIKVIYVVERLNEVFGLNGWHIANEVVEKGAMVVVKSTPPSTTTESGSSSTAVMPIRTGEMPTKAPARTHFRNVPAISEYDDVYKGLRDERAPHTGNARSEDGPEAHAHRAVASLTTKNMAERFSTLRTVLGGEDYEAILESLGCAEMGNPDLEKAREAYTALLDAFRARYREARRKLGRTEYRKILGELRLSASAGSGRSRLPRFSMHGGEVTSEAMSTTAARSRRHWSAGGLHRPHGERAQAV